MSATHMMFRPPAEAESVIVRVADGCPRNQCRFCAMYKGVPYRVHSREEICSELAFEASYQPDAKRLFLADGDAMALPFEMLRDILVSARRAFPELIRVSLYANGSSVLKHSDGELSALKQLGLHTLYMGLESGSQSILDAMGKPERVSDMVEAVSRAQGCGLRMSVMVLLGLGGEALSVDHARETATALNRMQPRLLSALRVVPVPGAPLFSAASAADFQVLSEYGVVRELRELVSRLELRHTVFRANHTSNVIPIEARLPRDQQALIDGLDALLASPRLDRRNPGPTPLHL